MKKTTNTEARCGAVALSAFLALTCFSLYGAAPVFAGFEWKGSAATKAPRTTPPVLPAQNATPSAALPADGAQEVESAPLALAPPPMNRPMPAPPAPAMRDAEMMHENSAVSGFGNDLPLAIALQQVAPAGHRFSFAPGVNPGQSVSWQGGKGWQDVMHDMLQARALDYRVTNGVITVVPGKSFPPLPLNAPTQQRSWNDRFVDANMEEKVPSFAAASLTENAKEKEDVGFEERRAMLEEDIRRHEQETSSAKKPTNEDEPIEWTKGGLKDEELEPLPLSRDVAPALPDMMPEPIAQTRAPMTTPSQVEASWVASKGRSLRSILEDWSRKENVDLYWSIDYDYMMQDEAAYSGSYEEAVSDLLNRFSSLRPQPYGQLHKKGSDSRVLVVNSYDIYD